jgi:hypothetical protein
MGITSSGVIWETEKGRFKPVKASDNKAIEAAFAKYHGEKDTGHSPSPIVTVGKHEVFTFDQCCYFVYKLTMYRSTLTQCNW